MHWETKKLRASFVMEIPFTFVLSAISLLCSSYGTTDTSKKTSFHVLGLARTFVRARARARARAR